jgi:hypothetical protein
MSRDGLESGANLEMGPCRCQATAAAQRRVRSGEFEADFRR